MEEDNPYLIIRTSQAGGAQGAEGTASPQGKPERKPSTFGGTASVPGGSVCLEYGL